MTVQETILDNGLRIVTETIPSIRSVAVGYLVQAGSRDERPDEAGCAHFLEHLLFKGSKNVSARELVEKFDELGAKSNAWTSKERTCFWAHMPDDSLLDSTELFSEMLIRPAFRQNEIDTESRVVIEEIKLNDDDPDDVAYQAFEFAAYGEHPLALPILGTEESISGMGRDTIKSFWQRRYNASSIIVSAAGNLNHEAFCDKISAQFEGWRIGKFTRATKKHTVTKQVCVVSRASEQVNLVLGAKSFSSDDERAYAMAITSRILGGGMASRLFMKIREERGLVYGVCMENIAQFETGMWYISLGTTPSQVEEVLSLIAVELKRILSEPVLDEELYRVKRSMRASILLAEESAKGRMNYLGRAMLSEIGYLTADERIAKMEAVKVEDILAVANELLKPPFAIGASGSISEKDILLML